MIYHIVIKIFISRSNMSAFYLVFDLSSINGYLSHQILEKQSCGFVR